MVDRGAKQTTQANQRIQDGLNIAESNVDLILEMADRRQEQLLKMIQNLQEIEIA